MRRSTVFLAYLALLAALGAAALLHASVRRRADRPRLRRSAEIVRRLELTDLCLFTEAQYTRHPAVTVLHTAFQDHPLSLEHFPSGAIAGPPPRRAHRE